MSVKPDMVQLLMTADDPVVRSFLVSRCRPLVLSNSCLLVAPGRFFRRPANAVLNHQQHTTYTDLVTMDNQ